MRAAGGGRVGASQRQDGAGGRSRYAAPTSSRALAACVGTLLACSVVACGESPVAPAAPQPRADAGPTSDVVGGSADIRPPDVVVLDTANPDAGVDPCGERPPCDSAAELGQLGFGCACSGPADCASGVCVETAAGTTCSELCEECCPKGMACREQVVAGSDKRFVCQEPHARLCDPCTSNVQCVDASAGGDRCVEMDDLEGATGTFCGTSCEDGDVCPDGYECRDVRTVDGSSSRQCVPAAGECTCSPLAIEKKLETSCAVVNSFGRCPGTRVCTAAGPGPCDAQLPAAEVCNGVDDDCDLVVDESSCPAGQTCRSDPDGFACACEGQGELCDDECVDTSSSIAHCGGCGLACTATSVAAWACISSTCAVLTCDAGRVDLDGKADTGCECVVAEETCDGADNDCDGLTDESTDLECADSDPCTSEERCEAGGCARTSLTGPACDDGAACTVADHCDAGVCVGTPRLCPSSACVTAECDELAGGCVDVPRDDGSPCDDGRPCTVGEGCAGGTCVGAAGTGCVGGGACVSWSCGGAGECVLVVLSGTCDDGDACTTGDTCAGGNCDGADVTCDDQKQCTTDSCAPAVGCVFTPAPGSCDDGKVCTENDRCDGSNGQCEGTLLSCDDGNPCTTDPPCAEAGERCGNKPTSGVTPCEDGSLCTVGEVCQAGVCGSGVVVTCDDQNACTDDVCLPATGCVHHDNTSTCNDGDACTTGEKCNTGSCAGGAKTTCPPGGPCTATVACQPTTGLCISAAVPDGAPCSDGALCTTGDACLSGVCVAAPVPCGPVGQCESSRACDPLTGNCQADFRPDGAACSDGDACSVFDRCTSGVCVAGSGALDCDDQNPCTTDSCDNGVGCVHAPNQLTCDDGNPCTLVDVCDQTACEGSSPRVCVAGQCHASSACDPATGSCVAAALADGSECSDGSECTVQDACLGGSCLGGSARLCDDGNVCTADGCDALAKGGCVHVTAVGPCSDGNPCTVGDACVGATCEAGSVDHACCLSDVECDAKDPDRCDGTLRCANFTCVPKPGTAVTCDPSLDDDCLVARCIPATGSCALTPEPGGKPCDDGDACSLGDACASGLCTPFATVTCSALDGCHVDGLCDPATGACSTPPAPDGHACVDGDACTPDDRCVAGQCVGGERKVCPAASACHVDGTCDGATGVCSSPLRPTGTQCDDGLSCTDGAVCQAGACVGGLSCAARGEACGGGLCFSVGGLTSGPSWLGGPALSAELQVAGTWLAARVGALGRALTLGALAELLR